MTEARLRQEAAAWKAEAERAANEMLALRLQLVEREKLGVEQANKILWYWEQNEKLRKRLESATEFVFHRHAKKAMEFSRAIRLRIHSDGKWGTCYVTEGSAFPLFSDGKNRFDTVEEAEAAALKALEVAG